MNLLLALAAWLALEGLYLDDALGLITICGISGKNEAPQQFYNWGFLAKHIFVMLIISTNRYCKVLSTKTRQDSKFYSR